MRYGVIFWGNASQAIKIFRLQKRAARTMCGVNPRTSCKPLFKSLGILTLASTFIYETILFIAKHIQDFPTNYQVHTYKTRQCQNLHYSSHTSNLSHKSLTHLGLKLYNKLPSTLKQINQRNLQKFKSQLQSLLCRKGYYSVEEYINDNCVSI